MLSVQLRGDASFVLDWLRQTNAPANIVALQERVVEALGGYVGYPERTLDDDGERSPERKALFSATLERASADVAAWPEYLRAAFPSPRLPDPNWCKRWQA